MDPELDRLGEDLTQLGTTVVPHGDHLCVRLPFFTSIRVRSRAGRLRFDYRFGAVSRELSVAATTGTLSGITLASVMVNGPESVIAGLAFVSVLSAAVDVMRLVVSEAAVTRVQLLWATRQGGRGVEALAPVATHAALDEGSVAAAPSLVRSPAVRASPPQE